MNEHLLGLEYCSKEEIESMLKAGFSFKEVLSRPIPKVPTLRGKTVVNLFFENSTRTRISFELAQKRLSADTVNFSASGSSVSKGESLRDTIRNIEAMKIDMVVVRHQSPGVPYFLTQCTDSIIINAGDGLHEHPTQGLLDIMTLQEKLGTVKDLKVVIVGDILHSRVARSNIYGLQKLGAKVALCGPPTLIPVQAEQWGVEIFYNIEDAIRWGEVLNVLRLQLERQHSGLFPTRREYAHRFGVTLEKLRQVDKEITIMHPGPINRGLELEHDLADSEFSVILDQVTNGVALRMAVLYLKSGVSTTEQAISQKK
ncbi:MAG: aspartate carbamoyltransferase catalytic subunit [Calditrichaeota bacterium]|nr:MAG: aspartate carbamoyltransferase catalytic subunit [Calditrichota bacterium]